MCTFLVDRKQFAVSLSYIFSNCFDILVERYGIQCTANFMITNTWSDKKNSRAKVTQFYLTLSSPFWVKKIELFDEISLREH